DATLRAHQLVRLVENRLDVARVLGVGRGQLARALAGLDLVEAADTALGLGDGLVGDDDDVAGAERGCGGWDQGGEGVARPDLGQAGERQRRERGHQISLRTALVRVLRRDSAVRSAARSSGVSMSSSRPGSGSTCQAAPALLARRRWRSKLPGPKAGSITSGGVSSSALVPLPWRSATIVTAGARTSRSSSVRNAASSSAGQSPGTSSARS